MAIGTVTDLGGANIAAVTNASTVSLTTTASASVGDLIIVWVASDTTGRVLSSVSDGTGNSYQIDATANDGTNAENLWICSCRATNSVSAGSTITATFASSLTSVRGIQAAKVSGIATSAWKDRSAVNTASSSVSNATDSGPTTQADELLIGGGWIGTATTASSGAIKTGGSTYNDVTAEISQNSRTLQAQWFVVSATDTYRAFVSWGASSRNRTAYVSYKADLGSSSDTPGPGGGTALGTAPTGVVVTAVQGGAPGSGPAPTPALVAVTQGGAAAAGTAPAAGTATQTAVARVSLGPGSDPVVDTGHAMVVTCRITTSTAACRLRMQLYQGATPIGGVFETADLTTSFSQTTSTLGTIAASAITDYSDLEIRFWGYSANGGAIVFEVDQLYLEIPPPGLSSSPPVPGGAIAGGLAPAVSAMPVPGGALAGGNPFTISGLQPRKAAAGLTFLFGQPLPTAVVPGGAIAGGQIQTNVVTVSTQGGGAAAGQPVTISVPVQAVATPAQGRSPGETIPTGQLVPAGGAVASGASPTAALVSVTQGGGTAAGVVPVGQTPNIFIGGATAAGLAPTKAVVTMTIGGANGQGIGPTDGSVKGVDDYAPLIPILV